MSTLRIDADLLSTTSSTTTPIPGASRRRSSSCTDSEKAALSGTAGDPNSHATIAWFALIYVVSGARRRTPKGFPWSVDLLVADMLALLDALDLDRVHLVGAKLAGTVARAFAARHPERMRSLTVVGSPPPYWAGREQRLPEIFTDLRTLGVERLGAQEHGQPSRRCFRSKAWNGGSAHMARTDMDGESQIGFMTHIECADIRADLPQIRCPTLVLTSTGSGVASVDETRAWQQQIPLSELNVLGSDSYHIAASDAQACARATAEFIRRRA